MKIVCTMVMILVSLVCVFAQTTVDGTVYFTEMDLAQYHQGSSLGHYVAIDGVVYDMTRVPAWRSGAHQGGKAGEDISDKIASAPHGKGPVPRLPEKGRLVPGLTMADLALNNGTNNMPRFVAVDGVVYDVTDVPAWRGGTHQGGRVGTDISDRITGAPHGVNVLGKRDVVGLIVK